MEAHWLIGKIEKYYILICCTYDVIQTEIRDIISKNTILQTAFKVVNDIIGPDNLIPTLLVFLAYLWIVTNLSFSPSQQQRVNVLAKAMTKFRKLKAQRGVQDTLKIRNWRNTIQRLLLAQSLGSQVQIYREKERWTEPFKVLDITDAKITVNTENEPVTL